MRRSTYQPVPTDGDDDDGSGEGIAASATAATAATAAASFDGSSSVPSSSAAGARARHADATSHSHARRQDSATGSSSGSSGSSGSGAAAASSGAGEAAAADGDEDEDAASQFECHICLETASEPTITQCGHLFCWPCLYRWMQQGHNECPVCKAGVSRENVIPLYGRGRKRSTDPRNAEEVPDRPAGHRPAAPAQPGGAGVNTPFGNITFAAGVGFFPSLFGLQFQTFPSPVAGTDATPEEAHQAFLSRLLIGLAVLVLICILFF